MMMLYVLCVIVVLKNMQDFLGFSIEENISWYYSLNEKHAKFSGF